MAPFLDGAAVDIASSLRSSLLEEMLTCNLRPRKSLVSGEKVGRRMTRRGEGGRGSEG